MGRRIRWLGVIMVACLGLVIAQLVNIQLVKAKSLQTSPYNPRIEVQRFNNPRGEILASDGTILAKSVAHAGRHQPHRLSLPLRPPIPAGPRSTAASPATTRR